MFDVFIPCKTSDVHKLKFVLSAIRKNVPGSDKIYIVSPNQLTIDGAVCLTDFDVLPKRYKDTIQYRPGWIFQQYLKLFQEVTADRYLVIDSDLYIRSKLEIIDKEGRPSFF